MDIDIRTKTLRVVGFIARSQRALIFEHEHPNDNCSLFRCFAMQRYEQQINTATFLKNDMGEDLSPCCKQVILN